MSSLIELGITTRKWHAIRLFAASVLHSPILGDNLYGAMIQEALGKYVNVGIFSELLGKPPKLNSDLLKLLHLKSWKQELIPVHVHLKKFHLSKHLNKDDLIIEAPLTPEFKWTCDQLQFKNMNDNEEGIDNEEEDIVQEAREAIK